MSLYSSSSLPCVAHLDATRRACAHVPDCTTRPRQSGLYANDRSRFGSLSVRRYTHRHSVSGEEPCSSRRSRLCCRARGPAHKRPTSHNYSAVGFRVHGITGARARYLGMGDRVRDWMRGGGCCGRVLDDSARADNFEQDQSHGRRRFSKGPLDRVGVFQTRSLPRGLAVAAAEGRGCEGHGCELAD